VVTILNQIYEVDFKAFSYGVPFWSQPASGAGRADVGIQRTRGNWALDSASVTSSIT
jgi:hypothetical protein